MCMLDGIIKKLEATKEEYRDLMKYGFTCVLSRFYEEKIGKEHLRELYLFAKGKIPITEFNVGELLPNAVSYINHYDNFKEFYLGKHQELVKDEWWKNIKAKRELCYILPGKLKEIKQKPNDILSQMLGPIADLVERTGVVETPFGDREVVLDMVGKSDYYVIHGFFAVDAIEPVKYLEMCESKWE